MATRVTVHLLESPRGHSVLSWTFEDLDVIRIGRSLDNHIVVSHPCVSRSHLRLERDGAGWLLKAQSEQGVYLNQRKLMQLRLKEDDQFRLGPAGPYLRFIQYPEVLESEQLTTFSAIPRDVFQLVLDNERLARDVSAIADDDYFRGIQHSIAKLRGRQGSPEHEGGLSRGS